MSARLYAVSTGKDYLNPHVKVQKITAERMIKRLGEFHILKITRAEYQTLEAKPKAIIKKESGFFLGGDGNGHKKIESWQSSSVAVLDLDDLTSERAAESIKAIKALNARAAIHSTASHSSEKPRLRAVVFLDTNILPVDYRHLIERLASRLPAGAVSSESYKPTQLMYFPMRCSDGEEVFLDFPGDPLEVAPILAEPRATPVDPDRGEKVTPAWDKPGIVGLVAQRYGEDLDAAIEELGLENVPYERASVGPTCAIGEARYRRVRGPRAA